MSNHIAAVLHPLLGERQVRPSPAETGEGASGRGRSSTRHGWSRGQRFSRMSALAPSPLRERAGVRVAATATNHLRGQQPSLESWPLDPSRGECWGEGSSGHPTLGFARASRERDGSCSLSPWRPLHNAPSPSKVGRLLLPLPVGEGWGEGLPGTHRPPAMCEASGNQANEPPVLIPLLGERVGVRGLPGTQSRVTRKSLLGDLCKSPRVLGGAAALPPSPGGEGWGEGSSGHPPLGYPSVSRDQTKREPPTPCDV